jgi:hypothetical protein
LNPKAATYRDIGVDDGDDSSLRTILYSDRRMWTSKISTRVLVAGVASFIAMSMSSASSAQSLSFGPHDVTSLFSISKSENKNQVIFALHLDEHCAPAGGAPVFAFWRMYEKGPNFVEPLLDREQQAYGIATERVLSRDSDGGVVDITLRAMPSRHIVVKSQRQGASCVAWSSLAIAGTPANLYDIYVKLKVLGVDYIQLSGWTLDGTHVVHEKVTR